MTADIYELKEVVGRIEALSGLTRHSFDQWMQAGSDPEAKEHKLWEYYEAFADLRAAVEYARLLNRQPQPKTQP